MKPSIILLFGSIVVILAWQLTKAFNLMPIEDLNTIFTGLGFVGLVAAFRHEQVQANDSDQEHRELIVQMRTQAKATCHAARVSALTTMLKHYRFQLDSFPPSMHRGEGVQKRYEEIKEKKRLIVVELEKAAETSEIF